jgi:hypothetical protein
MKYQMGESGNPNGRPKGSVGGRMQALHTLDKLLARRKTQATLIRALDEEFKKNPIGFFRNIIMPLLPREARLNLEHDGVLEWKSMLGPSATVAVDAPPTGEVVGPSSGVWAG